MKVARVWCAVGLACSLLAGAAPGAHAAPESFEPGSLIIPMDTTYQDHGMLEAYGLLYALLRAEVPVRWVIMPGKEAGQADFVASAVDHETAAVIDQHGYRAGPFVVPAAHADAALPVVDVWQASHVTAVHVVTQAFTANVAKKLAAAPTIAIFADGNEDIPFRYLNAAGIPDSKGQPWPAKKLGSYADYPDVLTAEMVAGPTTTDHADGALFDADGVPVFCQLMTMHWDVKKSAANPEVVAEMRSFLTHPTHLYAQCQAVNAIENHPNGRFLTPNGFNIAAQPSAVTLLNASYPFVQLDGPFGTVGGSEAAYSLPAGDTYHDKDIVMLTGQGSPAGVQDVWMTGYLDGACKIEPPSIVFGDEEPEPACTSSAGKISYLGGHSYETKLPITANPKTQGTRLFLNSLFEADCATAEGQPYVTLEKTGPAVADSPEITWHLTVTNFGPAPALSAALVDPLPPGSTLVGATDPFTYDEASHTVTWSLGNLAVGATTHREVTVSLGPQGAYANIARLDYLVGTSEKSLLSPEVTTWFDGDDDLDGCPNALELEMGTDPDLPDTDEDGVWDCDDTCPLAPNPLQDLAVDPEHCGACGVACGAPPKGLPACSDGDCVVTGCEAGWHDCDGVFETGCETPEADLASSVDHCGACGVVCAAPGAVGSCLDGECVLECQPGYAPVAEDPAEGCEWVCLEADLTCDDVDDDCDGLTDEDADCEPGPECDADDDCEDAPCAVVSCIAGACVATPAPLPGCDDPTDAGPTDDADAGPGPDGQGDEDADPTDLGPELPADTAEADADPDATGPDPDADPADGEATDTAGPGPDADPADGEATDTAGPDLDADPADGEATDTAGPGPDATDDASGDDAGPIKGGTDLSVGDAGVDANVGGDGAATDPGGCSCRAAPGDPSPSEAALTLLATLAFMLWRRRRLDRA